VAGKQSVANEHGTVDTAATPAAARQGVDLRWRARPVQGRHVETALRARQEERRDAATRNDTSRTKITQLSVVERHERANGLLE